MGVALPFAISFLVSFIYGRFMRRRFYQRGHRDGMRAGAVAMGNQMIESLFPLMVARGISPKDFADAIAKIRPMSAN